MHESIRIKGRKTIKENQSSRMSAYYELRDRGYNQKTASLEIGIDSRTARRYDSSRMSAPLELIDGYCTTEDLKLLVGDPEPSIGISKPPRMSAQELQELQEDMDRRYMTRQERMDRYELELTSEIG